MGTPQFCDVSQFQPAAIDWQVYKAWSASVDGISRVAMRSSYGDGYTDVHFAQYRQGALAAGIDQILYYHYAYPQINNPVDEAKSQKQIVGDIRPQDMLILDFEENTPNATSDWAYAWLAQQEDSYDGKLPGIYASSAYIAQRLQDARLAKYPLWLANWQFTPDERPPVPSPWSAYEFVQYTDSATNVPGIASTVDCNIFLGQESKPMSTVPQGWSDDGTTLTAPNKIPVVLGFRDHVLNNNWDPANWPLEVEAHYSPVEQSHPSLGGGQAQLFRWKRLEYTAAGGIIEGWLGQELFWYQEQYTTLQAEIINLQALLKASNLGQVASLGQQIADDVALIMKLVSTQ